MKTRLKLCTCHNLPRPIWKRVGKKLFCKAGWFSNQRSGEEKPTAEKSRPRSIPRQSPRRVKEDTLYSAARKVYLDQHPVCKMNIPGLCTVKATDIQHRKGRGKYYLDQRYWLPACRACHMHADTHPEEAIENGWALPRLTNE